MVYANEKNRLYEIVTHTACHSTDILGTVYSKMPVTGTRIADNNRYGLALPCLLFVRSIIQPIIKLVMASIIFEIIGNTTKKAPPHNPPILRTSVQYWLRNEPPSMALMSNAPHGPKR